MKIVYIKALNETHNIKSMYPNILSLKGNHALMTNINDQIKQDPLMTYIHSGQISLIDMGNQYVLTSSNEDQTVKVFDKRTAKCI